MKGKNKVSAALRRKVRASEKIMQIQKEYQRELKSEIKGHTELESLLCAYIAVLAGEGAKIKIADIRKNIGLMAKIEGDFILIEATDDKNTN